MSDRDGYPVDPRDAFGRILQPDAVEATELGRAPCTVVLGEAGIGKSDLVRETAARLRNQFGDDAVLAIDLGTYAGTSELADDLFDSPRFHQWQTGTGSLHLILDSLDEAIAGIRNVVGLFERRFRELPVNRLHICTSCRTATWPETLTSHFAALFGSEDAVQIYTLVPLLRSDVDMAAGLEGVDPASFLEAVDTLAVQPLASNPLSLQLLINTFKAARSLPGTRVALFERGLLALCEETVPRQERGTASGYAGRELLSVASRVAALMTLSGNANVSVAADDGTGRQGLNLGECVGGPEDAGGTPVLVDEQAVRAALNTGLFAARGPHRFSFVHKSYAEFLAARHLTQRGLTLRQLQSIFCVPGETPRRLTPQLHETAAWLAALHPGFFDAVLHSEPEVLLLSDTTALDQPVKAQMIDGLLARTDAGQLSYLQRHGLSRFFVRLRHDRLDFQLKRVIADASRAVATRMTAMEIAAACQTYDLASVIADAALDEAAEMELRVQAGYSVCELNVSDACVKLKPLAFSHPSQDPDDQLRGLALRACWPAHITVQELFRALVRPARSNFAGSYASFLHRQRILEQLAPVDLRIALDWSAQVDVGDRHLTDDIARLAAEVVTAAWRHVADPEILARLAPIILKTYREYECPFYIARNDADTWIHGSDLAAVNAMIAADPVARRRLLETVVDLVSVDQRVGFLAASTCPLARPADFEWLIEQACAAVGPRATRWAELANRTFDQTDAAHVDAWLKARQKCWAVAEVLDVPLFVEIDSKRGRRMKAQFLKAKRWERRRSTFTRVDPPPHERVQQVLERCREDASLFPWLVQQLPLEPNSTHYESAPADLRDTPGWRAADPDTRGRIIEGARRFLDAAPNDAEGFLTKDDRFSGRDLAAPQAMLLLLHEAPEQLHSLVPEAWRKWAPHVLVMLGALPDASEEELRKLCTLIAIKAPGESTRAIVELVQKRAQAGGISSVVALWEEQLDTALADALLERVAAHAFPPRSAADVLAWLLRHGHAGAFRFADLTLASAVARAPLPYEDRSRSIHAAIAAVAEATERFWPLVWQNVELDPSWGRQLLEELLVHGYDGAGVRFFGRLSDTQCGDLLNWLFEQNPPETDPDHRGVFTPTPRDYIGRFRSVLVDHLKDRGTSAACESLHKLRDAHPRYPWLNDVLVEAHVARRRAEWHPPEPQALKRLFENAQGRYVSGPSELLDVVCESLDRLGAKVHGTPPASPDLWNDLPNGRRRPTDEEHLSDYIARRLGEDIGGKGVVVNREVQIRPRQAPASEGGQPGQRVDIRIDAIRTSATEPEYDVISVILEVKGCWNPEVRTAMHGQLVERYLRDNKCRHGLYVVGWFVCPVWDSEDPRRSQVPWRVIDEASAELDAQASRLSAALPVDDVRAYVLDCGLR